MDPSNQISVLINSFPLLYATVQSSTFHLAVFIAHYIIIIILFNGGQWKRQQAKLKT